MDVLTVDKYNSLEEIKSLKTDCNNHLKTIDTLNKTIDTLSLKIKEVQDVSAKQIQIQGNGNKLLSENNVRFGNQIEELKNQVKALTDNLQSVRKLSDEKSADIIALKSEKSELEKTLRKLQDDLVESEIINTEVNNEILKLHQNTFIIRKELRTQKNDYELKLSALNEIIQEKEKLISSLSNQLVYKSPDNILRDLIKKGKGYVKKEQLESIDGAVFHKEGVVSFSHGGLVMHRNFLRDDYSLRE